jgi:hypothetical protein
LFTPEGSSPELLLIPSDSEIQITHEPHFIIGFFPAFYIVGIVRERRETNGVVTYNGAKDSRCCRND